MPAWLVVVLYVVAILSIVLIHEAGHFVTAKAFGIKVEQFFVGFGPRIWSVRRGETEYGLKALPFGGYVRIAGMNPFEETPEEDVPRAFGSKPVWQRAAVIGAGPITHFLMAIVLLAVFFAFIGVPSMFRPVVDGIETKLNGVRSPAAAAGLRPGDQILALDGHPIPASSNPDLATQPFISYTRSHVGQPISITVRRGGRTLTLTATPVLSKVGDKTYGRLGVLVGLQTVGRDRTDPLTAIGRGGVQTWDYTKAVVGQLGDVFGPAGLKRIGELLVGSQQRSTRDVGSVVAGGRLVVQAARAQAWDALLGILVGFNVFIGILNLVPLPPLDGGHLAVLAYEKIRRRRPDARKLVPLTALVAGFMILFAISVTYLDIVRPLPNPFR
jgi:membrane-associated protease RseP (regulator of RpoE activity)